MKIMLTGIFLAASAAPASIASGFYAFRSFRGGFPAAIETSASVSVVLLGLAFFVFMSGLVAKPKSEVILQTESR